MPNTNPPSIPVSVFSSQFQQQPSFPAIFEQAHESPFLVDMLTQLHARGNQIHVDAFTTRAAYYKTETGDIYIDSALFPAVNDEGRPVGVTDLKRFVSLLGHEGGHSVLQNHAQHPRAPDDARALGLAGEGVALTAEYIVASQVSGPMWSGKSIQDALESTAASHGKRANITTRRMNDPAANWPAFDASGVPRPPAESGSVAT